MDSSPISHPKPPLHICEGGFLLFAAIVASVKDRFKLIDDLNQMPEPPYKPARLIESETLRWYIVFYVWDAQKGILVRKRDYEVDKQKTKKAKKEFAETRIREINKLLANGFHIHEAKHEEQKAISVNLRNDHTISQAFKIIVQTIKNSRRLATFNSYSSIANLFIAYCKLQGWEKWLIKSLKKEDVIGFLDYKQANGLNNVTRNKYGSAIKAMLGMMVERKMIEANPAAGIKKEPEEIGKNIAYDPDQVKALKEVMIEKNIRLWYFVQFMFYGFIRPAEIGRLKVNMIDIKNRQIVMPANITKNRKIRYVRLSHNFLEVIHALDLKKAKSNDYVFGKNLRPGSETLSKNFAGKLHAAIVKDLEYGSDYTLYSWKHTGVVEHYRAGIDIKSLQQQLGHSSLEETDTYLKSLGLIADLRAFDNAPSI